MSSIYGGDTSSTPTEEIFGGTASSGAPSSSVYGGSSGTTFRLYKLSGSSAPTTVSPTTFRLYRMSGQVGGTITVELSGPTTVDAFEPFELVPVVSGGTPTSYTWQQYEGPLAEVVSAGSTLKVVAPANQSLLTLKFRVTVDPNGVTDVWTVTVYPATYFRLPENALDWEPAGEYILR